MSGLPARQRSRIETRDLLPENDAASWRLPARVTSELRPVVETESALEQMLAAFSPTRHGGEVMASGAAGLEAFAP